MVADGEVRIDSRYATLRQLKVPGDFRFVVLQSIPSRENDLPKMDQIALDAYYQIKRLGISDEASYGLDTSNVMVEKVPLFLTPPRNFQLIREV
jgi:KUP system potassium uptake protein